MNTQSFYTAWKNSAKKNFSAAELVAFTVAKSFYLATKNQTDVTTTLQECILKAFTPLSRAKCVGTGATPYQGLHRALNELSWMIYPRVTLYNKGELDLVQNNLLTDSFSIKDIILLKNVIYDLHQKIKNKEKVLMETYENEAKHDR